MDSKITKKRLSHMLSYDWIKIILTIVGVILVWSLVFSVSSTKLTMAQQFTVCSYRGNTPLSTEFYNSLNNAFDRDDVFSFEIIEMDSYDYTTTGKETNTLLTTRLSVGEGDVIFLSPDYDTNTAYTEEDSTEVKYKSTYAQTFIQSYYHTLFLFDQNEDGSFAENSFFGQMETYLDGFYKNGWRSGDLDEAKAEANFRARIKKQKDNRFKTEKQIEEGIKGEIERINKYRNALLEMYGYLENGYVKPELTTISDPYDDAKTVTHAYTLNICPDESKAEKLKNVIAYTTQEQDENGDLQPKNTAANMQVGLFNLSDVRSEFRYESLLYVNYVIRTSLTA